MILGSTSLKGRMNIYAAFLLHFHLCCSNSQKKPRGVCRSSKVSLFSEDQVMGAPTFLKNPSRIDFLTIIYN